MLVTANARLALDKSSWKPNTPGISHVLQLIFEMMRSTYM